MAVAAILYFRNVNLAFRYVNSVVLVWPLLLLFGSNICYVTKIDALMPQTFIWWRHVNWLPVSTVGHVVICEWPWRVFPPKLVEKTVSNWSCWYFTEIQDGGHLRLTSYVNLAHPCTHVSSEMLELCAKFGSDRPICYSLWDRRPFGPNIHLMTSRKLTSGFNFWSCGHLCIAMAHLHTKLGAKICIQTEVIDIFFKIQDGGRHQLRFFRYVNFPHSGLVI